MQQTLETYRRTQVQTATQEKLILMLYDAAIQRVELAKVKLAEKDFEAVHNHLVRAQDILTELQCALDMEAGEVAHNLFRIYDYLVYRLMSANMRKDETPLTEVAGHLRTLRDAWKEAFRKAASDPEVCAQSRPQNAALKGIKALNVRC